MPRMYPIYGSSAKQLLVALAAACIFLIVLGLGSLASLQISKRQFEAEAQNVAASLRSGIGVADGVVTSLDASGHAGADHDQLNSQFSNVLGNYEYVSGLGQFEEAVVDASSLQITVFKSRFSPQPETYTDLTGIDLSADVQARASINLAKLSDHTVVTSVPDAWNRPGELIFFRSGSNSRDSNRGYMLEVDLDELASSGGVEIKDFTIELSIFSEQGEFASESVTENLYRQSAQSASSLKFKSWFDDNKWLKSFPLGDKTLLLEVSGPAGLSGGLVSLLCLIGLFLSLIFLTIMRLIGRRRHEQKQKKIKSDHLYRTRYRAAVTLASIDDAVLTMDVDNKILYANEAAEKLLGYSEADMQGLSVESVVVHEEKDGDLVLFAADGTRSYINKKQSPLKDIKGEVSGHVVVMRDVSVEHALTKELQHKLNHDLLTGLANRFNFENRLQELVSTKEGSEYGHVLCFIDLDRFKEVNDTCGHDAGDELLKQVAQTFVTNVRDNDMVARLGGDEFGIVLRNCSHESAALVTSRIQKCFQSFFFEYNGYIFPVRCSIGFVHFQSGLVDFDDVLKSADAACFDAKRLGRNSVCERSVGDSTKKEDEGSQWLPRLKSALQNDSFELLLQSVASLKDGSSKTHEVLMRLKEKDSLVSPDSFMKSAIRFELAENIDRWVVENALEKIALLPPEYADHKFTINLTSQSIESKDFPVFLQAKIRTADIDPTRLCFDIKESDLLSKPAGSEEFCRVLRGIGCDVALDDFGAGMTSFALLKSIPITALKIDGSLIANLHNENASASVFNADHAIVKSIHSFASSMGLTTIAEQVESVECLTVLSELNVDYAQGNAVAELVSFDTLLDGGSDSQAGLKAA